MTTTTTRHGMFEACRPEDTARGWEWVPVTFQTLGEAVTRARMHIQGTVVANGVEVWRWDDALRPDDATMREWLAETLG